MKIDAIAGRGEKKDFCDLYFLLKRYPLSQMMDWYQSMFKHSTLFHVYKSLSWFEDAESGANPVVFERGYTWEKNKSAILKAIKDSI